MSRVRISLLALATAALVSACAKAPLRADAQAARTVMGTDAELSRIEAAIEDALRAEPPRGYAPIPSGVRLLSIARRDGSIVLDFSSELVRDAMPPAVEDALHQILAAASAARSSPGGEHDYDVLIEGVPLDALP